MDGQRLLPGLLREIAGRYPDRIAIEIPPGAGRPARIRMTYAALARESALVARVVARALGGEGIVALLLGRESPALWVAQAGCLVAGAAHLSLEPCLPDERLRVLLADAQPALLLTDAAGRARARGLIGDAARVLVLEDAGAPAPGPGTPEVPWLGPRTLAYVIYTSGTTGGPKGVLIEHGSIAHLVATDVETFHLTPQDRVAQGSSAAYDSSIEETWLAFAAGATLVVMDDETVRLGPDLVPWLCRERISVLCPPPTLLRTMGSAGRALALPELRLLYVGGEALTADIVATWGPGRWIENGYGPTECTITVLRGRVRPGEEVTIGRPIAGHAAWALDAGFEPVRDGEPGELCIAGPGLARGYLGRTEESAAQFVEHPRLGRIYRTGDLVVRRPSGDFVCLGRIDSQVKIRGHRVELEEVEAELAAHAAVREAACRVQGRGASAMLAAWIVPEDGGAPPSAETLRAFLGRSLPAHMVPGRFALTRALPRTAGGKLDRRALPEVEVGAAEPSAEGDGPADEVERRIAAAVGNALGSAGPVPALADFFDVLGGDSLGAAVTISILRQHAETARLTVRDVYELRTVRGLAGRASTGPLEEGEPVVLAGTPGGCRRPAGPATLVQTGWLLLTLVASSALAWLVVFLVLPALGMELGLVALILLLPVLALVWTALWTCLALALAAGTKSLLIGRYRPGRWPVYSGFYVRNWIVQRVVRLVPWGLFQGTVLQNAALRLLGARIGRRVHIQRGVDLLQGGWDLLVIGDDVTIGQDAALRLVDLEDGQLVIGSVTLGEASTLDVRSGVGPDAVVGERAYLAPLSWLGPGALIPAGEGWDGVPACRAGDAPPEPGWSRGAVSPGLHGLVTVLATSVLRLLPAMPAAAIVAGSALFFGVGTREALEILFSGALLGPLLVPLLVFVVLSVALGLLVQAGLCRLLGSVPPGPQGRWSWDWLRTWLKTGLVESAGNWLSGTLFWPAWLRAAGTRIGRGSEISTIIDVVPEHLEVGAGSFLADGIYLGGPRLHRGRALLATTRLGAGTFLGNHVVVPAGTNVAPDVLVGICTVAAGDEMPAGSSWFGHPAFRLPKREVVTMERRLTHDPGPLRCATRVFWELLRFALPVPPLVVTLLWVAALARFGAGLPAPALLLFAAPAASALAAALLCLAVWILKWGLLGRVRPGLHPLWSCWCSRWDFLYVAWGFWARGILANLAGTGWCVLWLRAMGCHVGRGVILGPGFAQVVDPDMLEFEDGCTVNGMFQAHSFEDRVLKIDRVRIRAGASVSAGSVLLYGADVGAGARLAPHGVVMKRERLSAGLTYVGCPVRAVEAGSPAQVLPASFTEP